MTIESACKAIIAGYAADKSILDDDMIDHATELADHAEEILAFVTGKASPKLKITKLYTYDELPSDKAKKRARDWWTSTIDECTNWWSDHVIEEAVEIGKMLGITLDTGRDDDPAIYWSGFSSQGDGASFAGTWKPKADAVAAVAAHMDDATVLRIAENLAAVGAKHPDSKAVITTSGRYSHSYTMSAVITEGEDEEDIADSEAAELLSAFRAFADWIYEQLELNYNDQFEKEAVEENIRINEYTFTAEGKRENL